MRFALPAGLLLTAGSLSGCGLNLVCAYDPHAWYDADNATYTLLEADFAGQTGSFDFDPVGQPNSRRSGSYSLGTGNLAWVDSYQGSHWLDERQVEGYGTIYDNGNLDLLVKVTWTDVLASTWSELLRIERYRCEGNLTRYDFDPEWNVDHAPESDAHTEYWASEIKSDSKVTLYGEYSSGGSKMVYDRTCTDKILRKTEFDYADGGYVGTSTQRYDGTGEGSWSQYGASFGSDYDYVGDDEYYFDGSSLQEYGVYPAGTDQMSGFWSMLYQYDGSATGSYTGYNSAGGASLNCDVTITTNGACTAVCDDNNTYDCS